MAMPVPVIPTQRNVVFHKLIQLPCMCEQTVYGIWTGLITNLPLNVLFIAQAARWLHPDRCADIDPIAILDTINRDFAAFPINGPLWAAI
jgi:iron complex transport system substrate-binding protein